MQYGSVNPELLGLARRNLSRFALQEKRGFVPGGDPSMGAGDPSMGGAPPGGDPSMGGGDPSMGGGGAPPPGAGSDPTAGVGGATPDISNMIQQQVQAAMTAQGGGMGGGAMGGGPKPKIDENVVMLQILKILAKIADTLGISIPASEMVVTPDDLKAMAQGGPGAAVAQGQAQQQGAPPPGGGMGGAIQPIQPMQGAAPPGGGGEKMGADRVRQQGTAFDTRGLETNFNKATAILAIRGRRNGHAA